MKRWSHPLDFVLLAAGGYAALSPLWTTTTDRATTTMVVLGVVTAALAILALARPGMLTEGLMAGMGVLFVISPWVMGFEGIRPMAWTAWVVGAVVVVAGTADLVMDRMHHRGGLAASH